MCADLKQLKWEVSTSRRFGDIKLLAKRDTPKLRKKLVWACAGLLLLLVSTAAVRWYSKLVPFPIHQPKLRQLTANSPDNPVWGGKISPDGKTLLRFAFPRFD
jgi:hypothetical protein